MDLFDPTASQLPPHLTSDCSCNSDLTEALTLAHVSQGMDPLQAALEAQLQAPLIEPFLF
ncbi:MAG: hypothetical protein EBX49_03420 [Synechococcaceae bacterium WB8_1B_136]|nr:hypothetical protein [Synechococcaceae bacterium WB8_1B_136]